MDSFHMEFAELLAEQRILLEELRADFSGIRSSLQSMKSSGDYKHKASQIPMVWSDGFEEIALFDEYSVENSLPVFDSESPIWDEDPADSVSIDDVDDKFPRWDDDSADAEVEVAILDGGSKDEVVSLPIWDEELEISSSEEFVDLPSWVVPVETMSSLVQVVESIEEVVVADQFQDLFPVASSDIFSKVMSHIFIPKAVPEVSVHEVMSSSVVNKSIDGSVETVIAVDVANIQCLCHGYSNYCIPHNASISVMSLRCFDPGISYMKFLFFGFARNLNMLHGEVQSLTIVHSGLQNMCSLLANAGTIISIVRAFYARKLNINGGQGPVKYISVLRHPSMGVVKCNSGDVYRATEIYGLQTEFFRFAATIQNDKDAGIPIPWTDILDSNVASIMLLVSGNLPSEIVTSFAKLFLIKTAVAQVGAPVERLVMCLRCFGLEIIWQVLGFSISGMALNIRPSVFSQLESCLLGCLQLLGLLILHSEFVRTRCRLGDSFVKDAYSLHSQVQQSSTNIFRVLCNDAATLRVFQSITYSKSQKWIYHEVTDVFVDPLDRLSLGITAGSSKLILAVDCVSAVYCRLQYLNLRVLVLLSWCSSALVLILKNFQDSVRGSVSFHDVEWFLYGVCISGAFVDCSLLSRFFATKIDKWTDTLTDQKIAWTATTVLWRHCYCLVFVGNGGQVHLYHTQSSECMISALTHKKTLLAGYATAVLTTSHGWVNYMYYLWHVLSIMLISAVHKSEYRMTVTIVLYLFLGSECCLLANVSVFSLFLLDRAASCGAPVYMQSSVFTWVLDKSVVLLHCIKATLILLFKFTEYWRGATITVTRTVHDIFSMRISSKQGLGLLARCFKKIVRLPCISTSVVMEYIMYLNPAPFLTMLETHVFHPGINSQPILCDGVQHTKRYGDTRNCISSRCMEYSSSKYAPYQVSIIVGSQMLECCGMMLAGSGTPVNLKWFIAGSLTNYTTRVASPYMAINDGFQIFSFPTSKYSGNGAVQISLAYIAAAYISLPQLLSSVLSEEYIVGIVLPTKWTSSSFLQSEPSHYILIVSIISEHQLTESSTVFLIVLSFKFVYHDNILDTMSYTRDSGVLNHMDIGPCFLQRADNVHFYLSLLLH